MKTLVMKCACGRTQKVSGVDAADIIRQIDAGIGTKNGFSWTDQPVNTKGFDARCPDCNEKWEKAYNLIREQ